MARLENARDTEVRPGSVKVWEILRPFFALGIQVAFVDDVIHPPILAEVALVIDAVLLVGDLLVDLEEGGKLAISNNIGTLERRGSTWKMLRHFAEEDGNCLAVVELDEIGALGLRNRRVHGNIDDSALAQRLDRLVEVVDARARGEGLVLLRNLVVIEGAEEAAVVLEGRVEGAR